MSNRLFEDLRPELEEWISWYRVPCVGPLDIMATAERIGVSVLFAETTWNLNGLVHLGPPGILRKEGVVEVNSLYPTSVWPVTFGHEIGHWLLKFPLDDPLLEEPLLQDDEEVFCERFGRELVLPSSWLQRRDCTNTEIIAREMRVDLETAFYQMWEAGVGPEIQVIGEQTFCVWHGDPWVLRESPVSWRDCECREMFRKQYGFPRPNTLSDSQKATKATDDIPF